ncbi:hypothetical protein GCM10010082_25400 [Kushneria pakistanensis]|uniref:Serine kinase/phosphatase n=1 Tax=Kushneria pakistanensis TaxID=1508770 RepID=A0ABQ3FMH6_9GAMM|nr:hypothetical protein [Kushneria pakistanensis]GHC30266.1 hypothetical protein GCM10010082_25400 [Kushneria pakistanensis]
MDEEKKGPSDNRPARDATDVTAATPETDAWTNDLEDINDGTGSTEDASILPDENDEYADLVETGALDEDERLVDEKDAELENELEVTDADEEGIEANIKALDFEESEGGDHVDPQRTRPDMESRDPDDL